MLQTEADDAIAALEATGNFRVLRRLLPRTIINTPDSTETKVGVVVDVETTGLDPKQDQIIELAMVPFSFGADGRVFEILPAVHQFQQPTIPIPAEITAITGIDDAMVAGKSIDISAVEKLLENAVLIVAHQAAFDRPFAERVHQAFRAKCWACSMSEIDWRSEGFESTKLAWLLAEAGYFYDRHRALSDCVALIELLARPLPKSGVLALSALLDKARQPTLRIWAQDAPFDLKDRLKARGYRWSPGDSNKPKSWFFRREPFDCRCRSRIPAERNLPPRKLGLPHRSTDRV